jgi:ABC-type branched-subunit amino acid transport system permease subunit
MKLDRTEITLVAVTAVVLPVTYVLPPGVIDHGLFSLARALAVLGLILLWRCGLISFGHGLYFGIGGYTAAVLIKFANVTDIITCLLAAAVLSGLVAFFLGFIIRRYRGIFFSMLSLAFSMVLYGVLVKSDWLGSTDGFSISQPTLFGLQFGADGRKMLFMVAVFVFALSAFSIHRYLRSIVGSLGEAIRDNEIRVTYLGFSVPRAIHLNYVLSGALAGVGGAMMATAIGQVDPDSMVNWTVSGELFFVAILSGYGSVLAPAIGSITFEYLHTYAVELAPQGWNFIVGSILLLFIFVLPRGIWSLVDGSALAFRRANA